MPGQAESDTLDAEGSRIASHLSASHVTDCANRLLEDDQYTYSYDVNGNLTGKTAKAAPFTVWAYTCNIGSVQHLVQFVFACVFLDPGSSGS